jgi:hypothetical protein
LRQIVLAGFGFDLDSLISFFVVFFSVLGLTFQLFGRGGRDHMVVGFTSKNSKIFAMMINLL